MKIYQRRQVVMGLATLVGGALTSTSGHSASKSKSGTQLRLVVERAESLQGLSGKALQRALLKQVRIRIAGTEDTQAVALCAVRVEKNRAVDTFLSRSEEHTSESPSKRHRVTSICPATCICQAATFYLNASRVICICPVTCTTPERVSAPLRRALRKVQSVKPARPAVFS